MKSIHTPVLVKEVISYLNPKPNQNFIDCTIGGAGHAQEILERNGPQGKLLGLELDPLSLQRARKRLIRFGPRAILVQDSFVNLKKIAESKGLTKVQGVLFDLGLSSIELEKSGRGFSFLKEEPLDMRFDPESLLKASDIVNQYSKGELANIFYEFGEEPKARIIAQAIVKARKEQKIKTTKDLVDIIKQVRVSSSQKRIHPATRVFQALRIAVNQELDNLEKALPQALEILAPHGRLVVISFHSLEDRIVKNFFRREARGCICPPEVPQCVCDHSPQIKILTKKPIRSTQKEIKKNPRARSARLRAAQKI